MSPIIMPVIVRVLCSTQLSSVSKFDDGNNQNNSIYTSEHVLIFAVAYLTALSVVGKTNSQKGIK